MKKVQLATVERVCRELARSAPLKGIENPFDLDRNRGYRQALLDVVAEVRAEQASGR